MIYGTLKPNLLFFFICDVGRLQTLQLADADPQNFLDLRTDSGSAVHKMLQTWSDTDAIL